MFQNAFIGNVAINICGVQCSEYVSVEYTIKLPYKVI